MIRTLIASDCAVIRKGFKHILDNAFGVEVVSEASTMEDVWAAIEGETLDVILADVSMSGLEILSRLKAAVPQLPVILWNTRQGFSYAIRALRAGAKAYLVREAPPEQVVEAIHVVVAGMRFITPEVGHLLASMLLREIDRLPHEVLSTREFQVFHLIALGNTTREIATHLCLSANTVRTYRARIFKKTGFKREADLILYVAENNVF